MPRLDVDAIIAANWPAINVALQRYHGRSDQVSPTADYENWKHAVELRSSYNKVKASILALRDVRPEADPGRFARLAAELAKIQEEAPAFVEHLRPKTREDQLIIELVAIWEAAGQRLGASKGGPACRYLCKLLPWQPKEKTAMSYISAAKRRRSKSILKLDIDETKITVVDKDGKIK
jgi:hypothetical protein